MDLSREEIAMTIEAVAHYADEQLKNLGRLVPAFERSGQVDAARSRMLGLLAKYRQELAKPEPEAEAPAA